MAQRGLQSRRWLPSDQPQTLTIAAYLLYWNAAIGILIGIIDHGVDAHITLVLAIIEAAGAFGIANKRRIGYATALCGAIPALFFTLTLHYLGGGFFDFLFQVALVILLVHPHSRAYIKSWFH